MVVASSVLNAFCARVLFTRGTAISTLVKGLAGATLCFTPQAKTVRAARTHTFFTVVGARSLLPRLLAQSCASSLVIDAALWPLNVASKLKNTPRQRAT